ncbi:MAG: DUF6766 family protein [Gaiellaceae bacterium]
MRTFLRENGLSLFFASTFLATLTAQSFAGQHSFNSEQLEHGASAISWWEYVTSVTFWGAVMENWQSEFLQFTVFIGATIWLVQKGSNESKRLEDAGRETNEKQRVGRHASEQSPGWAKAGGWRRRLYENSLLITMSAIFFTTWFAQSLNYWRVFNNEQREHSEATVSWGRYLLDPDFWETTLQNWQSEFLAVGVMVVFTIYLRQRGSPESKPVGAPHDETGTSG